MRLHVFLMISVALIGMPCLIAADTTEVKPTPNFVVILIDDLRYDTFGHMDHPFVETPNIDALAQGGLQFTRAFVTTSLCSPSRASFLTGQYMHNHRVVDNADLMPEGTTTFPQLLQQSGYQTAFVGKWHMGGSTDAARPGFDHWVSFLGQGTYAPANQTLNVDGQQVARRAYMTDELTDYAVDWLQERSSQQPFLLYLSHKGVHGLYDPAPRHVDRYKAQTINLPGAVDRPFQADSGKPMWVQDQRNSWHGVEFPYYGRSGQTLQEMYRHYCEMILSIDESVGRVMQALLDRGLENETLVLFTSDGGHMWGEHGLIDKRCAYEPSIRIPLLAYGPGFVRAGQRCDALVANIDVAPTLLELAGQRVPEFVDGNSFAKLLEADSPTGSWRQQLLYEYYWEPQYPQTPTTFCLRGERFKLIQYHGVWDLDELYDLENDPEETNNLIADPQFESVVTRMRSELYQALKASKGLAIPLGFKRNLGSNARHAGGSKRAEFPSSLLRDQPTPP